MCSDLLIQENSKLQDLSVHRWLSHQRPVRVGLHCQARCDHHPWRQCSLYYIYSLTLNLQLDNGCGSSDPCPLVDCLQRWQSLTFTDSRATHAIILTQSQTQWACCKKWKVEWEALTGMCWWSTSTFKNSSGCTALDKLECREMTEQIHWLAKQPIQVDCF